MSALKVSVGLKQSGGILLSRFVKPISIVRGQSCVIGAIFMDAIDERAITLSNYTVKMNIKNQDGSILTKTFIPVDNGKGECEFDLSPSETLALPVAQNQNIEFEVALTATPDIKTFVAVQKAISVAEKVVQ